MKLAAAYIRVSTDDQLEYSPESQIKAIRAYAKANSLIIMDDFIFQDDGISGRSTKRPEFQRMIATAKTKPKPFDSILVWKFSRFARNREDSIVFKSMLRKQCGIDVISVSEPMSEDKTSILIEALIEAMDEYYSLNLSEEVKRGMNEKFSRGGIVSQPPFGYIVRDGVFIADDNANIVKMIFEDFLGGLPTRAIAIKLNSLGVKTNKGNPFENRTVEYILSNPVYIGKLRRSKTPEKRDRFHMSVENTNLVNGKHEPIISAEIFEKVQEKLSKSKEIFASYARQSPAEFMLKGLVKCDTCGGTLVMSARGQGLQCHKYSKGVCKVSHYISLNKLNLLVLDKIISDLGKQNFEIDIEQKVTQNHYPQVNNDDLLKKEYIKLERVKMAFENGIDTVEEYKANKQRINDRISEIKSNLQPITQDIKSVQQAISVKITKSLDILRDEDTSETLKNITLRSIVEKIIFQSEKRIIEIIYRT